MRDEYLLIEVNSASWHFDNRNEGSATTLIDKINHILRDLWDFFYFCGFWLIVVNPVELMVNLAIPEELKDL